MNLSLLRELGFAIQYAERHAHLSAGVFYGVQTLRQLAAAGIARPGGSADSRAVLGKPCTNALKLNRRTKYQRVVG